jgi:glycosyltransferase involved in cell wall biosynthesis
MFNRAAMFNDAGHDCTITHLDYKPDFDGYIADLRKHGRLREDVKVKNPFTELMELATTSAAVIRPDAASAYRSGPMGEGIIRYSTADDRLLKKATFDSESRLRALDTYAEVEGDYSHAEYSAAGWKERESTYTGGTLAEEHYFTPDGKTYLIRQVDPGTGAQAAIQTFGADGGGSRMYKTNTAWHTAWFEQLAAEHDEKPVFICDGPGSAAKVINIKPGVAGKAVALHNVHFSGPEFKPGQPFREASTFLKRINSFDALVVLTDEQAADVATDIGNRDKMFVIPNSLQVGPVPDVAREPLRISTFGKLIGPKGTDNAIRAFQLVHKKLPDATLNIFGAGSQWGALSNLAAALGVAHRVTLHGYTHEPNVEMAKASAVVFPSKAEAWGFTIAESFLNETPVVAFECKYGPGDLIEDGADGYLVPPGDVAAMADRLIHVLENPDQARAMGAAGREKIVSTYTGEPLMKRWEEMFESLRSPV